MPHRFIAYAALAGFLVAPTVRAEPKAENPAVDYEVWEFENDEVNSAGTNPYGEWMRVNRKAPRAMLIRPRTSFVFELLASVGKL